MKRTVRLAIAPLLVLALSALVAFAADTKAPAAPPSMEMPQPAPELAQLAYFAGDWTCKGKQLAGPMGPEHPYAATFSAKKALDGFWYRMRYEEKKSKVHPHILVEGWLGWDGAAKRFLMPMVDNFGGNFLTASSPGWEGDAMEFTGTGVAMAESGPHRLTFMKEADGTLRYACAQTMNGQLTPMCEGVCTKAAK
jgi:hypothetical protein